MRVNWADELLLQGRDPYRSVYLLRFVRLQYAFATSMLVVVAFTGFLWWSGQQAAKRECLDRNQRTAVSVQILEQLAAANHADGDTNAEQVWRQWIATTKQASLPRC